MAAALLTGRSELQLSATVESLTVVELADLRLRIVTQLPLAL
jgi:hypothetical protein